MIPTKQEAEELLIWANEQNPGVWVDHSRVVARAAKTIASRCGLDIERAYVSGLLHDIGRWEGRRDLHHIYSGYELMKSMGYYEIADVCLSHSFPTPNVGIGEYFGRNDCTKEETDTIVSFLVNKELDDYDRLIQLCDSIGTIKGVSLVEVRLIDVIQRHGFNEFSVLKIAAYLDLKRYFDRLCGINIYSLFYDEIQKSILD